MRKRPTIKLFYKFIITMILISTVPLAFQGIKMISINSPVFKNTIKQEVHSRIASSLASYIDEYIAGLNLNMDFAVAMELFPKLSWEDRTRFLLSSLKANDDFIIISMLDKKGMELTKVVNTDFSNESNVLVSRGADPAFSKTARTRRPSVGPLYYQEKFPRINIVYPLNRQKEYVFVSVTLTALWKNISSIRVGNTGFVYLVNRDGQIIYHPDIDRALNLEDVSHMDIVKEILGGNEAGSMEFIDYHDDDRKKMVGAFAKANSLKWGVIVQQSEDEAYRTLVRMKRSAVFWILITIIVSILVAVLLSVSMTRPIRKLTAVVEKFGKGDLSQKVNIKTHDELLILGNTFNLMAENIRSSQDELVAKEKMAALGQMASVVGHEIRNPLGVINNAVYYIKTRLDHSDPKIDKHLSIIEREVAASNKIVSDLLGYSRTRAVKLNRNDINAIIRESVEVVGIPDNISLEENIKDKLLAMVDPDEAREMFINIIDNACQSMPDGGTLTINTKKTRIMKYNIKEALDRDRELLKFKQGDSVALITISNTGAGIAKENMNKIFKPFFTTRNKGTGLGLAVVQRIVDRCNGAISAESRGGKGATFIIRLPV